MNTRWLALQTDGHVPSFRVARNQGKGSLGRVVNANGLGCQDELPYANPAAKRAPMGVGHCQEPNRGIVKQGSMAVADDLRPDPKRFGLTRQAEPNLKAIAAPIAQNGHGIEQQAVLTQAGHECRQDLVVRHELRVERHRNESLTVWAYEHCLRR